MDDLSLEESFPELRMNGLAHVRGKKGSNICAHDVRLDTIRSPSLVGKHYGTTSLAHCQSDNGRLWRLNKSPGGDKST